MIGVESLKAVTRTEDEIGAPSVDAKQIAAWRKRCEDVENAIANLIREKNLLKIMIESGMRFMNGDPVSSTILNEGKNGHTVPIKVVIRDILKENKDGIRANGMDAELRHRGINTNISYVRLMMRGLVNSGSAKVLSRGLYTWNDAHE
jgi:hypothetical protein